MDSSEILVEFIRDKELFREEKPYTIVRSKEHEFDATNAEYDFHDISANLEDVRGREGTFSLEKDSMCFLNHKSEINVTTEEEMMIPYAKEVNDLLRKMFDTEDVICYDLRVCSLPHAAYPNTLTERLDQWRRNTEIAGEDAFSNNRMVPSPPVRIAHIDHTPEGGWNRIRRHLSPEELKKFGSGQYRARIINVWRPLFRTIKDNPIALCVPSSVDQNDLLEVDRVTSISHVEIYQLKYNPGQKWRWLRDQQPDEPVVFVQFDSHPPDGKFNVVPHSTFLDPKCPPNAPPRDSVETRSLVFTKL